MSKAISGGANTKVYKLEAATNRTNRPKVFKPSLAVELPPPLLAMAVSKSDISNGITVMRILLIHSDPTGFIQTDMRSAKPGFIIFRPVPSNSPKTRLLRMAVDREGVLIDWVPLAIFLA